jgi:hypothetical protein
MYMVCRIYLQLEFLTSPFHILVVGHTTREEGFVDPARCLKQFWIMPQVGHSLLLHPFQFITY